METNHIKSINKDSSLVYVSTNGNDSNDGSKNKPFQSLNKAIETSQNNSIINLNNGIFLGENNTNLIINKTLTIQGNNTILNGENTSRIFLINNAKLTLIGLNLQYGFSETYGGTILNNGGELILINSTLTNSKSNQSAGAIFSNGTLTIINSNISNNSAYQYGGAIYSIGLLNVSGSYFEGNSLIANKSVGASFMASGINYFNNSTFNNNHAIYSAAAISSYGNTTINNTNFINQSTNYTGGAISNHENMTINNSYFKECYARFYAAALLAPPSGTHVRTEVYNCIFEKNHVGNHGAVSNNFKDTELLMENCALLNNYIEQYLVGNRYYGDISLDDNASLLYCWWGQNEISPYYYSPHNDAYESWKINASKWLIMTFDSNSSLTNYTSNDYNNKDYNKNNNLTNELSNTPITTDKLNNNTVYVGELNTFKISIKQYFDNETKEIKPYYNDINLPLEVKLYTDKGSITTLTLKNGTASYNFIPNENINQVYATINNQTLSINVTKREKTNIIAEDLLKYYKNDSQLLIKLLDSNNNSIANKNIRIKIGNKEYTKTTNENGTAKLNINLFPKIINATISFKGDLEYQQVNKTIKITVLKNKTSIIANNLVKYYQNSSQLSVKLLDNNKKAVQNKTILIKISGKTYIKKTNAHGIAKLNINLNKGSYFTKIQFTTGKYYNSSEKTITVKVIKPIIKAQSTKIHKNSKFVATFKDSDGKLIKNTKVQFTLNKKTYVKTTNSKGQASIIVNLAVNKYYTIKSQFKSTNTYGAYVLTTKIKVIK